MTETVEHRMTDDVVGLLRHAIATASNDDFSKAGSSDRARHTERIDVMAKAADEIDRLTAALASEREARQKAEAENTRLRAALAQSDQPCAYCSLPADEWAKCASGFPGCDRADDAMGCPELGAALERDTLRARVKALEEALLSLTNNADGMSFREDAIRNIVGNTNWRILRDNIAAARSVLKETKDGE